MFHSITAISNNGFKYCYYIISDEVKMNTIERVIEGLKILNNYNDSGICADHDIIMAGPYISEEVVSETDKLKLDELGWFVEDEHYAIYV